MYRYRFVSVFICPSITFSIDNPLWNACLFAADPLWWLFWQSYSGVSRGTERRDRFWLFPAHAHPPLHLLSSKHTHTHAAATSLHAVCLKESSLDSIQDKRGEMRTRGEKNHSSCTTLVSLSMQKPLRSLWSSVWRNNVAFDVGLQYRTGASLRPQLNPYKNVLRNYKTHRGDH